MELWISSVAKMKIRNPMGRMMAREGRSIPSEAPNKGREGLRAWSFIDPWMDCSSETGLENRIDMVKTNFR